MLPRGSINKEYVWSVQFTPIICYAHQIGSIQWY